MTVSSTVRLALAAAAGLLVGAVAVGAVWMSRPAPAASCPMIGTESTCDPAFWLKSSNARVDVDGNEWSATLDGNPVPNDVLRNEYQVHHGSVLVIKVGSASLTVTP